MSIKRILYSHSNKKSFRNDAAFDIKEQRQERDKRTKKDKISGGANRDLTMTLSSDILHQAKSSENYWVEKYWWTDTAMNGLIQQKQYWLVLKNIDRFQNIDKDKVKREMCLAWLDARKNWNTSYESLFIRTMFELNFSSEQFVWLSKDKIINFYLPFFLKKKEDREEKNRRDRSPYAVVDHWSDGVYEPTLIESTIWDLSHYVNFDIDTAKLLLDKWHGKTLINNFRLFDKEWQKYLLWYYIQNRGKYAIYNGEMTKIEILYLIYYKNSEYWYSLNYKNILKDLLIDAVSHAVAEHLAIIANKRATSVDKTKIRWESELEMKPRDYAYTLNHGKHKIWHLVKADIVIKDLTWMWIFDTIDTVAQNNRSSKAFKEWISRFFE